MPRSLPSSAGTLAAAGRRSARILRKARGRRHDSEVMQRIAMPMIGAMIASTLPRGGVAKFSGQDQAIHRSSQQAAM
jgi:hypothetical protein